MHSQPNSLSQAKAPRVYTRTNEPGIPAELNQLFTKAGLPARDVSKLNVAIRHSLLWVTARLLKTHAMVGFIRASGDGIFNITIWDLVVDPTFPNVDGAKTLLIERLKREIRQSSPHCSVSIFANAQDIQLLNKANFAKERKGIQGMVLMNL
ncbi:hypothetical protein [Moorena sp. SIO4G3]|uniref:hypothetical protein n=1 Tax=Moorena sp. SIO4G3 TaxID=2607821 RepID=UPI00142AE436|nr:hypothetical protein [Moorena sp. SIO4G3]NEO82627.1 hypothetical protein [Moorena sp. SIO4G3]